MGDLQARNVVAGLEFVAIHCREPGCRRLLLKALPQTGSLVLLETVCPICKAVVRWTVIPGRRPMPELIIPGKSQRR